MTAETNHERHGTSGRPRGRYAARLARERGRSRFELPVIGVVTLPPVDQLAYLAGVACLVGLSLVEWPVGVLLGAGHLLAADRDNKVLAEFGAALEEAG